MVIGCLGFRFDPALFDDSVDFEYQKSGHVKKYPKMTGEFESEDVPGVFYAGSMPEFYGLWSESATSIATAVARLLFSGFVSDFPRIVANFPRSICTID